LRLAPHPLIYDWNHDAAGPRPVAMLDDETLRDGLQSPSVRTPSIDEKIELLHHMDALGIDTADIGLPGAGPRVARDVERLAKAIAKSKLKIRANCACHSLTGTGVKARPRRHRHPRKCQPTQERKLWSSANPAST